jgi:hypothetical protein
MNQLHQNKESGLRRFPINYADRCVQFNKNVAMPIVLGMATFSATATYNPAREFMHASAMNFGSCILCNENSFVNRVASAKIGAKMTPSIATLNVTTTPIWLEKRMETLRQMQQPTLQEVRTQLKASAEIRKKLTDKQLA